MEQRHVNQERPDDIEEVTVSGAAATLTAIGSRVRALRNARVLTLQELGEVTGLSASMLSLVERGRTSPSIGTLVSIASALGVHMSDLVAGTQEDSHDPLHRLEDQPIYETPTGVTRRVLRNDRQRGIEIAINEYAPGGASAEHPLHHGGYEYGIVMVGVLTLQIDESEFTVRPGDLISYASPRSHRIYNKGKGKASALWINLDRSD
jgi:transcriptional regulator with XRE-family HTH domain